MTEIDDMVERVARAIESAMGGKSTDMARAAIEAMREPTEAMVEAGWNAAGDQPQTHWVVMIDEALK